MNKYCLIIKTGEAEIRAIQNSDRNVLQSLFPVIEITRGRKRTVNNITCAPFSNRLQKLKEAFKDMRVGIDITSLESLSSHEINELYDSTDGYDKWVKFLVSLKREKCFSEIIPTIVINNEDEDFEENLLEQVGSLKKEFNSLIYRTSIEDDTACYEDLILLREILDDTKLIVIIDCEYTPQASCLNVSEKCIARINNIRGILGKNVEFVVTSTSFPDNISDIGDSLTDEFKTAEVTLVNKVQEKCGNDIIYSDYGSISVKRNDNVVMARGWIPRIDIPTGLSTFYFKQRRPKGTTAYSSTYINVANLVVKDLRFPSNLAKANWGIRQVINCAKGATPSSSPSFWISVRMCIHIEQQVRRLKGQ